jgi:ferredoxin
MSRFPVLKIDKERCRIPFACKKCLQICPQAVFEVHPIKQEKYKETDPEEPGTYRLIPTYRRKCTVCDQCIEVCDKEAITIHF